jgi:transcriptional regulator with XRE-family HTH domain
MTRTPKGIDAALGQIIRHLRVSAGLTQTDLGHAVGVSFQQMQKYEMGLNRISVDRLIRLAEALEMPASDILVQLEHGSIVVAAQPGTLPAKTATKSG